MIWTVTNSDELSAAFGLAQGGDRIELTPGVYDSVHLKNQAFTTDVVITSQDTDNPAVFVDALRMSHVSGVTLSGVNFEPTGAALDILDLLLIQNASDVAVVNNTFKGHIPGPGEGLPAGAPIDTSEKAKGLIEGQPFARGLRMTNSEDLTIDGNVFTALRKGIILDDTARVGVTDNHLHDMRSDGINIVDSQSVEIATNLMHSFRPLHNYENIAFADHGDFIQWWTTEGGSGIHNMTIRDNVLLQGEGTWVQGIFGRSGHLHSDGSPAHVSGLRIIDNVVNIAHPNGIFVGDARDVEINGNTLLPAPRDPSHPEITDGVPAIHIRTSAALRPDGSYDFSKGSLPRDVSIRDNLVASGDAFRSYQIDHGLHDELGISAERNTALSSDPSESSYFGTVFPAVRDSAVASPADLVPSMNEAMVTGGVDPATIAPWILEVLDTDVESAPPGTGTDDDEVLVAPPDGATLDGLGGDDVIDGSSATDLLRGGAGSDILTTGGGADTIVFRRSDLEAGDTDTITDLDFATGTSISFSGGFAPGFFDDAADPENVLPVFANGRAALIGSSYDLAEVAAMSGVRAVATAPGSSELRFDFDGDAATDWTLRLPSISAIGEDLSGLANEQLRVGTPGADVLRGTASGGDDLFGGTGDDVLIGGLGADRMSGGEGGDRYYVDHSGDRIVERSNHGHDLVYTLVDYAVPDNTEVLTAQGTEDLRLIGNPDDNWLIGNSGENFLLGRAGQDRLVGLQGSDWLDGGLGGDVLQGGAGDDRYFVDDLQDVILEVEGEGYDRVYTSVDYDLDAFVEAAISRGSAGLEINGNDLNNWIIGGIGSDQLSGGSGSDRLIGFGGDDFLEGGAGADVLQGGDGSDVFSFSDRDGIDNVLDFQVGMDRLDFGDVPAGAVFRAIETSNGVVIFHGPSDGIVVLSGLTERALTGATLQTHGQDWTLDF
ncbi:MAG: right-handed parallel beta-helix repeat-containing protein [Paracoccaceae bacterium]